MNKIQILVVLTFITSTISHITFTQQQHPTPSVAAIKNKAAAVRSTVAAKKAAQPVAPATSAARPAAPTASSGQDQQIEQLVNEFIEKMSKITCSCGASKKGEKVDPKQLCKHDQDHTQLVKAAYDGYEKLYEFMKKHEMKIEYKLNEKVLPSVRKLFECKNIQHKAWHPKVTNQPSSAAATKPAPAK